jgi:NADP-dependent aldehyde dehydrogenase
MEFSMELRGEMLLGQRSVRGAEPQRAFSPASNGHIEPEFWGGGEAEVDRACRLAAAAYDSYSRTNPEDRAKFLEAIADNLVGLGDILVQRCMAETGLPQARVQGEQGRTAAQLRMFAAVVRRGLWRDVTIDSADPNRKPLPKPDLRMQKIGIGPVGVFGASNFPILYSVAGGDTASALASGCPVVVKAHFSHLGTSELVGRAIQEAVAEAGLHEGVFSLVMGEGNAVGEALVKHPEIKAVAFTGSESGGMALFRIGQQREEPIPVFAEMTSVNPNFVLPHALESRAQSFATRFVEQMTLGVGQMCLTPGMIVAIDGVGFNLLRTTLRDELAKRPAATMLSPGLLKGYQTGLDRQRSVKEVRELASGGKAEKPLDGQAHIFEVDAGAMLSNRSLADEVFGPQAILIKCESPGDMIAVAESLRGQLTMAIQLEENDIGLAKRLMPILERRTNRILANGFSNMVEISDAMIHGGPFPATSDPRFTSVGSTAIDRFLRPICYQNMPTALLPSALADGNPLDLWRLHDSVLGKK